MWMKNLNNLKIKSFFKNLSKIVIFDRDGVINVNKGLLDLRGFYFQNGAIKAIKELNKNGYNIL